MWMFFKREVMFFELPGAGGNDIFWAPRTVYLQHLRILWCIIHIKEFLTMLAYFIWMCFWFLYRKKDRALALSLARSLISNSNNSITYYSSLSRAFSLSLCLSFSFCPLNHLILMYQIWKKKIFLIFTKLNIFLIITLTLSLFVYLLILLLSLSICLSFAPGYNRKWVRWETFFCRERTCRS